MARSDDKRLARKRKRRKELFGAHAIDKGRIAIRLCFGKHHSTADADELEREMRDFRPDVFVQETADMPAGQRIDCIRRVNRDIERARANAAERRKTLADAATGGAAYEREYCYEERRVIVDAPGVRFFAVEGYSDHELHEWRCVLKAAQDSSAIERALLRGDVESAVSLERTSLEMFHEVAVRRRNDRVARGFNNLGKELLEVFPELGGRSQVRVLSRFGRAHEQLATQLGALALDVSVVGVFGPPMFSDVCLNRLSAGLPLSDEDVIAALFQDIHSTFCPELKNKTYSEWTREVRRAYEGFGGAAGFRRQVGLAARMARGGPGMIERLRVAVLQAAR